jgi:Ca2+:H+ antiporter
LLRFYPSSYWSYF